jgi:RNA polymerase sigma factor (sigma-70 family)
MSAMPQQAFSAVVQLLRRAAAGQLRDERADAELLARFARDGDEAAFEVLVHRHGPMVWNVCRRLLARTEDAEDAFQAAFLVLVRRAGSIRDGALLGNWLYGVAHRVAVRARARAARCAAVEKNGFALEPAAPGEQSASDWQRLLHEEVFRLPEKYRRPIVLCYLGGKTNEQAAGDLGWPVGTVKGRLTRARDLLRGRLSRRGITLSAAALTTAFATSRLEAAVPMIAVNGLSPNVLSLTRGVLRAMIWTQYAMIGKVLGLFALVGAVGGYSLYYLPAAEQSLPPAAQVVAAGPQQKVEPAPAASTPEQLQASSSNLRNLALAMHNYHDQYGHFPPAAVISKDGKPLVSWRVLLLPYLDQEKLFREFKLDQPWDSEHNKKLLARMPAVYAAPRGKTKETHSTFYQVFTGKGTIFDGQRGTRIVDVTDGTSNTILIIESGAAVPWTKPADLVYDAKKPLPRLGGIFPEGLHFALADGSSRFCKMRFREPAMRAFITRNGGEVAGDLDDE